MPDMPMQNPLMPSNEQEAATRIKWMNYLQGGGLSILIALGALGAFSILFKAQLENQSADREAAQKSEEFIRTATQKQTEVMAVQNELTRQTNENFSKVGQGLIEVGDNLKECTETIKDFGQDNKLYQERLDSLIRELKKENSKPTVQGNP